MVQEARGTATSAPGTRPGLICITAQMVHHSLASQNCPLLWCLFPSTGKGTGRRHSGRFRANRASYHPNPGHSRAGFTQHDRVPSTLPGAWQKQALRLVGCSTELHSISQTPGRPLADAGRGVGPSLALGPVPLLKGTWQASRSGPSFEARLWEWGWGVPSSPEAGTGLLGPRSEPRAGAGGGEVVRKLQESGFYWSTVTGGEANLLLSAEPAGTFLIRDSSDQRHFFTLSVKTQSGTKNLRIQCEGGSFSLQSDPRSTQPVPRFDCVLKLVHHYMPAAGAPSFSQPPAEPSSSPSSEVPEQPPAQPLSGNPPRRAYYIYSGGEKIPLVLSRPLSSNVATLQHLCRKTVNGHLDSYEKVTQLPGPIREFLDQYDAPL
ncbi:PREDICTED: suppressor of cytokine signaling 3 [Bison bison bison]|uniref:Suppressor of cytokine signaling 3 n=1 Tax=Bison bison bison TaxID=43346 RepID=A0A6P3IKG6_BISBB|nr:PREDICTED: suppressor of cytokine signaling 3 [Bison bison bison]